MDVHINFPKNAVQTKSHQNCKMISTLVILAIVAPVSFAQPAATLSEESASVTDANAVSTFSFPFVAEITGNDVNIRSGPGTNYYSCGKLYKGDRVEVVSTQFGWSRIVPPVGCFSWISMQYVSVNLDNPTIGIVTGNGARVYAGADDVKPMHSTSEQIKLNRGDKVKLLGQEKDDYYKIAPPSGAYLWVSSQYTKPAVPIVETPPTTAESTVDVNTPISPKTSVGAEKPVSREAAALKEYYALQKQIKAERAKPIDRQNYADIKKKLSQIANNKEAGRAARYAELAIRQIEGFELALAVAREVQLQNEQLQQVLKRIDQTRVARLAKVQDLGKFVVIGIFSTFETYGPGHYRIVDNSGNTICYALPGDKASQTDLSSYVDQKVGLIGMIEPHPQTAGAVVRFTEVVKIE